MSAVRTTVDNRGVIEETSDSADFEVKVGSHARVAIPTLSDLSSVKDGPMRSGAEAFVASRLTTFILDKSSTATVADGLIVSTRSGVGRWVRQHSASPVAAAQHTWYIDSVSGSDDNDGTSSSSALKTYVELERRWGSHRITGHNFIYATNGLPASDPIRIRQNFDVGAEMHFIGARTQVATGTIASVTDINRATGQHMQITITGFNWTPHVHRLVRITSGARAGASAWIESDLGGGAARVSGFKQTVYGAPGTTSWSTLTAITPQAGDDIEIVTLATLGELPMVSQGAGSGYAGRVTFEDFSIPTTSSSIATGAQASSVRYVRCSVSTSYVSGATFTIMHNCWSDTIGVDDSSFFDLRGGLLTGTVTISSKATGRFLSDLLISGGRVAMDTVGVCQFGDVGVVSSGSTLCTLAALSSMTFAGTVYGTTSNQIGFDLAAGATIVTPTGTVPTVSTGSAANLALRNGVTKTWADLSTLYTNPANGARLLPNVA